MKVLALAGDAGGARAVLPVIRLVGRTAAVECRAYAAASRIWRDAGLAPLPAEGADPENADRVVLGTTVGPTQWEPSVVARATLAKVRTVTVVDAWSHYVERFAAADGSLILPNAIAVPDPSIRDAMVACGFPPRLLFVTGSPALDELSDRGAYAPGRARTRTELAADDSQVVLFVSQPIAALDGDRLGYDERGVLADVVASLDDALARRDRRAVLLVKLHPREMGTLIELPGRTAHADVRVIADDRVPPRVLAAAADLVIGMSSMLLLEACLIGRPVISYQPERRGVDPVLPNLKGWSRAVYRRDDLTRAIYEEMFDPVARRARRIALEDARVDGLAARRVADLLMAD